MLNSTVERFGEYILEQSVSVRVVTELIVGEAGQFLERLGRQSNFSAKLRLHFAYQWPVMLKCISKQNLIKLYHAVQELSAFSQSDHDLPDCCSAKPRLRFAYQWPDNVKM